MVATVLKLRYRALANTLARRPWQLVGFIFGALWAIGALVSIVAGMVALAVFQPLETATVVAVLGGSALLLGWVLGPILLTGMDTSIDARGLAVFPFTRTQTMLALGGTGLTGLPGIATTLAALSTVILWVRWPLAAVVSIPAAMLAVITCVLASRLVGELSGVLARRQLDDQRERGDGVAEHAGELLLHELEAADRPLELVPLPHVAHGGVERPGLQPGGDPGHVRAHRAQDPRDVAPPVHVLQPGLLGHGHGIERDERVLHGAQ